MIACLRSCSPRSASQGKKKKKHSELIPDGEGNGRDSSFKCKLRLARMEERNLSKSKQVE